MGWRAGDEVVDLSALGELFRAGSLNPLRSYRVEAPSQDPLPLPHLAGGRDWALDVDLDVELNGATVSCGNARSLYWTMCKPDPGETRSVWHTSRACVQSTSSL